LRAIEASSAEPLRFDPVDPIKTADRTVLYLWGLFLLVALAVMAVAIVRGRRRGRDDPNS
jgi:hypothetical protein